METKVFEVRDRATFIPVIAIKVKADNLNQQWLLRKAGYDPSITPILLVDPRGHGRAECDPYDWGNRTWTVAHDYIESNYDILKDGAVIDVEHILGETTKKKRSERFDQYNPITKTYTVAYEPETGD
jgi:hypothetical protein